MSQLHGRGADWVGTTTGERRLMGRLRRFDDHRFIGTRDTMRVYDCDDEAQYAALDARSSELDGTNLVQTFGPDTLDEARNRGFRPAVLATPPSH